MKGKRMAIEQLTITVNGKETPAPAGRDVAPRPP